MQRSAVGVLHARRSRACDSRDLALGQQARAGSPRARLCPGCGRALVERGVERPPACPCSASSVIAPATSAVRRERARRRRQRERADRAHHLRPVDERERPPWPRGRAARARRARAPRRRASARRRRSASPSPMTTSARCASGARSPEAPTEPCAGMTGRTPRSSRPRSASTTSGRTPEQPLASTLARRQSMARVSASPSGSPDAAGVRAHQVDLQLPQARRRDAHLGELAEAGVDPVDRAGPRRGCARPPRARRACARARARRARPPRACARRRRAPRASACCRRA